MYHFSTVSGMVSIEKILLMIEVRIPLEKKLMRASSLFISLRAVLFLNWEMCSGMNDALNLSKKSCQTPKLGGVLCKAISISVNAHSPGNLASLKEEF